jgi:uncharacterized protein (DUF885 family)
MTIPMTWLRAAQPVLLAVLIAAAGTLHAQTAAAPGRAASAAPSTAATALRGLLDADLAENFRREPMWASVLGVPGYNALLPDLSDAEQQRVQDYERATLARVQAIDAASLHGQDRLSHQLLLDKMRIAVEAQQFVHADELALTTLWGIQSMMPLAAQMTPMRSADDYRDFTARLKAVPRYAEQMQQRLVLGLQSGWVQPRGVVDRTIAGIDAHLVADADASVLLKPFAAFVPAVPEDQRDALLQAARAAVRDDYQPAMRRLREFLVTTYRPKAPVDVGLSALPGGGAYYDFLIRTGIVHGLDAGKIHALGLREVARLRREIAQVARQTGFKGSAQAFMHYVSHDKRFFFKSEEELLASYRAMSARIDPQLPTLFHTVPRMAYQVRGMSASEAASSTAANYTQGSLELGTPGYFTVNAPGYAAEPTWEVETLFMHEAVPGHHLQGARAAEVEGLHDWRRYGGWNVAYGEGWALYAESLGFQLGMYRDPYQHYGHLQGQLFRAARLVVDTGIHAYRWPRAKAVDYMIRQAGLEPANAASEVDRYFSNPSQALGYLLGKRKLLELRERSQQALGARFDLRDFHAVVIDSGTMPLAVLEQRVDAWIARGGGRPDGDG